MLNTRNLLLGALSLLVGQLAFSQKGTQTPYSAYGLGELNSEGYSVFSSMGGISMGNTDSAVVNSNNPASYSYIGRHMPVFQVGLNGRLSTFSTSESETNQRHFGLNQFQLGLPIKENWGASIGVKPYSFTGYTITKYTVDDEDTTRQAVNEGSGGIRIATLGLAYRPLNSVKNVTVEITQRDTAGNKSPKPIKGQRINRLSIGANGQYLFGTSQQIRSVEFIPSTSTIFNARVIDGLRVSGLSYQLGVNYQYGFQSLSMTKVFSVGATYTPATEVRAFQDLYSFSYVGSFYRGQSVSVLDTIEFVQDNQGVINKPEAYGVGFEYRLSGANSNSFLRIGADVKMEKWSDYYTGFSDVETNGGLRDRMSAGIGLEWTPMSGTSVLDKGNVLGKLHYRLGFNYTQTELLVENSLGEEVGIDNYGMSFGLGIPVRAGNSNTNINFGASLGNLGTTENGLIQERYMGLYFGLSITPLRSARWFVKRKYN